jgi:O-antigen/teichoic acid export membrane protein
MRSNINKLYASIFVRNVFLLTAGSALAQSITFFFTPFLTRLYSPEVFGILGVFMSFVSIVSPVAAFCYPIAIPIPRFDSDAITLARLSILIGFFVSLIMGLVFYFLGTSIVSIFNLKGLKAQFCNLHKTDETLYISFVNLIIVKREPALILTENRLNIVQFMPKKG